jgi:hypothetical protein
MEFLTHQEKQVIKDYYDFYLKKNSLSFVHILERSVDHIILEGIINLTEDEDGSCEKQLIEESRIYLESLYLNDKLEIFD